MTLWLINSPMVDPTISTDAVAAAACSRVTYPMLFFWSVRWCGGRKSHQWGVQDLEEKHPVPVWSGDDSRAGVAQPHRPVASRCQQVFYTHLHLPARTVWCCLLSSGGRPLSSAWHSPSFWWVSFICWRFSVNIKGAGWAGFWLWIWTAVRQ